MHLKVFLVSEKLTLTQLIWQVTFRVRRIVSHIRSFAHFMAFRGSDLLQGGSSARGQAFVDIEVGLAF